MKERNLRAKHTYRHVREKHVHHMNHMHMVTQDSDARVVIQECDHQLQRSVSCQTAACVNATPVQTSVVPAPSNQQQISSRLLASADHGGCLSRSDRFSTHSVPTGRELRPDARPTLDYRGSAPKLSSCGQALRRLAGTVARLSICQPAVGELSENKNRNHHRCPHFDRRSPCCQDRQPVWAEQISALRGAT